MLGITLKAEPRHPQTPAAIECRGLSAIDSFGPAPLGRLGCRHIHQVLALNALRDELAFVTRHAL